ncbi:unnamed protein product [Urochloa humidicola]
MPASSPNLDDSGEVAETARLARRRRRRRGPHPRAGFCALSPRCPRPAGRRARRGGGEPGAREAASGASKLTRPTSTASWSSSASQLAGGELRPGPGDRRRNSSSFRHWRLHPVKPAWLDPTATAMETHAWWLRRRGTVVVAGDQGEGGSQRERKRLGRPAAILGKRQGAAQCSGNGGRRSAQRPRSPAWGIAAVGA